MSMAPIWSSRRGIIQLEANDPADTASRDNIRMHLSHIAKAFSNGDFAIPMFVDDTVPPGVWVMKQMGDKITYKFEETPAGGRVLIATSDSHSTRRCSAIPKIPN